MQLIVGQLIFIIEARMYGVEKKSLPECSSNRREEHRQFASLIYINNLFIDHVERKVLKYENHKLRERKVKTLTRN